MKPLKAFSLVEILMVVTLLALSIGLVVSWTLSSLKRSELITSTESLVGILRQQQIAASNGKDNENQGMLLSSTSYTIYAGSDYASSASESRQNFTLPGNIQISSINLNGGGSEITFSKATGETNHNGTLTLTHNDLSESYSISINPLGLVTWQ